MKPAITAIREACLGRHRIDTHGHLTDASSSLEKQVEQFGHFTLTGQMNDSRVLAEGCRVLHGADVGAFLRPDSPSLPLALQKAADLRKAGGWKAIEQALDKAGIDQQIVFCSFNPKGDHPFVNEPTRGRIRYLCQIDKAINSDGGYPCPDFPKRDETYYMRLCNMFGELNTLQDYLDMLDKWADAARACGVVGMKTSIAYSTGLSISNPSEAAARAAFSRKNDMSMEDFITVHDYVFHHMLQACRRNGLPIVIHTGFPIWGHGNLAQTNPMLLHNILIDPRYKDLTFVLLHGGNPYTGETTYLAGMFPNVIIDFTWISWMMPSRFKPALAEWLLNVPYDRICWGSDSSSPEGIAGTDSLTRRLIADVLEESIQERLFDEKHALEFIENSYRNTARRVFAL